ncbi:YolD-like family protein [Bacillus mycoides]|uniref:YolD-like family protein n=1 Tax=Bacillus mycoides TaxID=1405 RepID=UPI00273BFA85|nr:YolD-like family protein [Bacillus mycoides]WOA60531.1 YolD-like family protein [Bacillus mycoides]
MPEQCAVIREIIKEKNKLTWPILTTEEKELIENMLLCSLLSEEILITYYEDDYLLTSYMTVVDIDPLNSAVVCTDEFYNRFILKFIDIIDVK